MKSTNKLVSGTELLDTIKTLNNDTKKYWHIIQSENVLHKREDVMRTYDLKQVYNKLWDIAEERILTKLDSLCLDLGFTSRSQLPETNLYPTIYRWSELRGMQIQLLKLQTIDPRMIQKYGKSKLNKTEHLSHGFVQEQLKKIQLEMNKLDQKMNEFNAVPKFDRSGKYKFQSVKQTNAVLA